MKRLARIMFLIITVMVFCGAVSYAGSSTIKIRVDGTDIVSDPPPIITEGRTLVPARSVFEAMGGTVSWNAAAREVTININGVNVKLKIDASKAYINGTETQLDVPARIVKNRTMIPVRFVSEAAGCKVSWDDKNRVVGITSPSTGEEKELTLINSIELSREGDRVIVNANEVITDFKSFSMTDPSRLILDINNAKLKFSDGAISTGDNPYIKSIRFSQRTTDSVRVVADLTAAASGEVTQPNTLQTIYMSFMLTDTGDTGGEEDSISEEDQAILDRYGLSPLSADARHKLVVIDPGHGGSDTGSRGYENGVAVLNEKDVNLDIALRLQKMLEAAGARIYMIRTEDVTIPLYNRQDTANSLGASLYVAVHNNSYTNATPSGIEVHYHGKSDPPMDGISAMELAENLQETLVSNLGLPDRGTKVSPELAVLRRTVMPAVIIEGAFISNPKDLEYMKTDDFREKYAMSAALCIIETLNNSVE